MMFGRQVDETNSPALPSREDARLVCATPTHSSWRERLAVYFLRSFGIVLVVSAAFKFAAADESIVSFVPAGLRGAAFGTLLAFEVVFGLVLFIGARRHLAVLSCVSVLVLMAFVIVNVLRTAVLHETTCGCLGAIRVHPRTMAGIDTIGVVALVVLARPQLPATLRIGVYSIAAAGLGWFPVDWYCERSQIERGLIAIDVDTWVGRPFPLLDSLSNRVPLGNGDWVIMLYDPSCAACHDDINGFVKLREVAKRYRLLIIIVGNEDAELSGDIPVTRLASRKRLPTPSYLLIRDSVVLAAERTLENLSDAIDKGEPRGRLAEQR